MGRNNNFFQKYPPAINYPIPYTNSDQPSTISIDRSSLCDTTEHSHEPCSDSDLVKHLKGIIKDKVVLCCCKRHSAYFQASLLSADGSNGETSKNGTALVNEVSNPASVNCKPSSATPWKYFERKRESTST